MADALTRLKEIAMSTATPSARAAATRSPGSGPSWRVLVALLVLSLIPLVSGAVRLVEIAGGPELLPVNPRIAASPAPLVLHVVGAALYAVLGAFQFSARLRRRRPGWHRRSGRVAAVAGLVVAGSGIWMTLSYSGAPGGVLLWVVRLLVSTLTAAFIVLGITAIRHRQVNAHRAWMIRAYALAVGAGTQAFTEGLGEAVLGVSDLSKALSMSVAWAINAAIAEWAVRTRALRVETLRKPGRRHTGIGFSRPMGRCCRASGGDAVGSSVRLSANPAFGGGRSGCEKLKDATACEVRVERRQR